MSPYVEITPLKIKVHEQLSCRRSMSEEVEAQMLWKELAVKLALSCLCVVPTAVSLGVHLRVD